MSLQSTSAIRKWNFTAAIKCGPYLAAVLALFLVATMGHSQTTGTRAALSIAADGAKTTLSVTVKDPTGAAVTDGAVSFLSNGQSLGSAIIRPDGSATLVLDKLPPGIKQITAVYSGSERFAASTSSAAIQSDTSSAPPDFSVTANVSSLNLNAGDFGTVILTITPENGFTQSVTLAISGLPFAATSVFTPSIVTPPLTSSTLQIQTTASSKSSQLQGAPLGGTTSHLAYAMLFPGVLALVGIGALRKHGGNGLRLLGVALLLVACSSGLTACSQRYGYLHHPPAENRGTPAGTYPVTVTAYSNNGGEVTSHTLSLTLTVK